MLSATTTTVPFDTWLGTLRTICGNFDSTPMSQHGFQGSVSKRAAGGIDVANITTNAEKLVSPRARLVDDDSHCFLIVQKQGRATLRQDDVSVTLRPGEMALMDSTSACEIYPHGLIEHDSFHLQRNAVAQRFDNGRVPFMKIASDSASGQILQLIVNRMVTGQPFPEGERESGIADSLIALLPAIQRHQETSPDQANGTLYHCINQFIDQHLHEENLSPERLASSFHISIRQLYRLFEWHEETVCRYVQRRRLKRCAEALANPAQTQLSITQIAYQWGFTDSAHFSRSFKREFGCSPREYRRIRLAQAV